LGGLLFSAVLFGLWVVLSGKLDAFHLGIGAATAVWVARLARNLLTLPPAIGRSLQHPLQGVAWFRVATYVPWLAWQIALSSIQIARVVFDPNLPIRPSVVRFESGLPHTLARLTLAHSITLTPGTVTLDLEGDEFVVHALTSEAADEIGRGSMQHAVHPLFGTDRREGQR
jgi:multicomponent Na+:H+ antiporter subunit E